MRLVLLILAGILAGVAVAVATPAPAASVEVCEARWADPAGGRTVPVRIRLPAGAGRSPVILFSHGLGGSLDSGSLWVEAWVRAGFATVNVQHPGSDRSQIGGGRLMRAMSREELAARARDIGFVLDELGRRQREGGCDLSRLDLTRVGVSGHSYGAHTVQALAGQRLATAQRLVDPRIRAAIAFSPSPPFRGDDRIAFGEIRIPFFSVTGTADTVSFLPRIRPEDRERPFRAMPSGGKYLLVLAGANHMAFNGQAEVGREGAAPDPHVRETVVAATTDFWRWTLIADARARDRLAGLGARLASGDRFEAR